MGAAALGRAPGADGYGGRRPWPKTASAQGYGRGAAHADCRVLPVTCRVRRNIGTLRWPYAPTCSGVAASLHALTVTQHHDGIHRTDHAAHPRHAGGTVAHVDLPEQMSSARSGSKRKASSKSDGAGPSQAASETVLESLNAGRAPCRSEVLWRPVDPASLDGVETDQPAYVAR